MALHIELVGALRDNDLVIRLPAQLLRRRQIGMPRGRYRLLRLLGRANAAVTPANPSTCKGKDRLVPSVFI